MKKRIVVDFDDTLALGKGLIETRQPNYDLINELNKAKKDGYEIYVLTARGQLSCGGDSKIADKKYRPVVERWLSNAGLDWDILDFHKPLASVYIDDKACEPEFFEYKKIESGLSGEDVVILGDKIIKQGPMSKSAFEWYERVNGIVKTPKIYGLIDDTIMMEYIEHEVGYEHYEDACNDIEKFKRYSNDRVSFEAYMEKIRGHLELADDLFEDTEIGQIICWLKDIEYEMNMSKSLMHGDASIDNILRSFHHGELYFIDPINQEGQYSSWLLDISKLLFSMKRFNVEGGAEYILKRYPEKFKILTVLDLCWAIRILKYDKANKRFWVKYIRNLMESLSV